MPKEIKEEFKWFVAGFTAGEGSFYSYPYKTKNRRQKAVSIAFEIKLNIADSDILFKIKDMFDCGHIYFAEHTTQKGLVCKSVSYSIRDKQDLNNKIIPFFDKYNMFNSKKQISYLKWKQCMKLVIDKKHLTEEGFELLKQLSKKINK